MSKMYIHYGNDHFDPDKFNQIMNLYLSNKPSGGLWASPCNAERSWYKWCKSEKFRIESFDKWFTFTLKDDAKILTIKTKQDLCELENNGFCVDKYTKIRYNLRGFYPDFEKLAKHYDAIEVYMSDTIYWGLYGWDCDSLLVLNPDCVVPDSNIEKVDYNV